MIRQRVIKNLYFANDDLCAQYSPSVKFFFVAFLTFRNLGYPYKTADRHFISSFSVTLPLFPFVLLLRSLCSCGVIVSKRFARNIKKKKENCEEIKALQRGLISVSNDN